MSDYETIEPGLEKTPVPPSGRSANIGDSIVIVTVFIVATGVMGFWLSAISKTERISISAAVFAALVVLAGFVAAMIACRKRLHMDLKTYFPIGRVAPIVYPIAALGVVGSLMVVMPLIGIVSELLQIPQYLKSVFMLTAGPAAYLGGIAITVLMAPLTEEILFRGVLLQGFLDNYRTVKAVAASAIVFTIAHMNPWQSLSALALGFYIGLVFTRTGSILPGIAIHALFNAGAYGIAHARQSIWIVLLTNPRHLIGLLVFELWFGAGLLVISIWLLNKTKTSREQSIRIRTVE